MSTKKIQIINSIVNADTTLTKEGFAADAKVVGDALKQKQPKGDYALKSEIPSINGLATEGYVNEQISKIPTPDVSGQIEKHNTSDKAHNDIRLLITNLTTRLNTLANSDDTTLDQMSEVVAYIKNNKSLIDGITTNKINISDIINNLTTNVSNKPLSAAQGVAIKKLIDALQEELDSHTHDASDITSGTLSSDRLPTVPISKGGTGAATSLGAEYKILSGMAKASTAVNDNTLMVYRTSSPSETTGATRYRTAAELWTYINEKGNSVYASKANFDNHVDDTTIHITSTDRTDWNAAKAHADSTHAPSNAEKNQNAFSNIKVGSTTVAADTATDTLELVGSNVTITPDATNDKITIAVASGSTSSAGILKLTNSTSSTSTTTAATPSSVKSAYDLANTAKTNAATAQTKADSAYTLAESKVDSLSDLGITATATELNYVDGVTSSIQTQLDDKLSKSGGTMTGDINLGTQKIVYNNSDADITLLQVGTNGTYGYRLQYNGAGSGNDNTLVLISDNQTGTEVNAITVKQDGTTTFAKQITASGGIVGNASTATKATQDASGNVITSTYATKSELNSHTGNTTKHITSAERTNWNAAKTHADSAHAPTNAEPNQNAFSNVTVGSTTIAADSKTDTLTLVAGSNITLTPDASNDKITIAAKDTTYSAATTSANGLMTSAMVTKLNGIATGANKTTVDSALSSTSTNPVQNKIIKAALDKCGSVDIDLAGSNEGEANHINADTLGGYLAEEYIKKTVSEEDNGKFLRVVNGVATWTSIPNVREGSF